MKGSNSTWSSSRGGAEEGMEEELGLADEFASLGVHGSVGVDDAIGSLDRHTLGVVVCIITTFSSL